MSDELSGEMDAILNIELQSGACGSKGPVGFIVVADLDSFRNV